MTFEFPPKDVMEKALQALSPASIAKLKLSYQLDCYTSAVAKFLRKHGLKDEFFQDKEVSDSRELLSTGIHSLDDSILTETQTKISEIEEKVVGIELELQKLNKKNKPKNEG